MKRISAWIARNERHLSALVFLGGFLLDNIALDRIDLPWVEILYGGYVVAAAVLLILAHYLASTYGETTPAGKRPLSAYLMLGAQFFIGGLLSGCLIFYARGAAWNVSWPFVLMLAAVFIASEFLHSRKERLSFQVSLFFLGLYLYAIYALPIALLQMGPRVFIESGLASIVLYAGFLCMLFLLGRKRLLEGLHRIVIGAAAILAIINGAYFLGILPPLPLSLTTAGIYHDVARISDGYRVAAETEPPAWQFWNVPVLHVVPGTPLFAYSAVFAPVKLTTGVVHVWERKDGIAWTPVTRVPFPITGGRDSGYRGYSETSALTPGQWRVSIETESGQVIGTERFNVEAAAATPPLHTEMR